ncbi:MAG: acyl-CoA thioesterase [Planctomycetes bacterium]|nr:acyl-CoA thioesterase [Planctomycetota bacterium]
MENHKLVMPENLSHYGYLFGGDLLKWVDEYAWIAASLDYPRCNFVTVGLDKVEFKKSVRGGAILKFVVEKTREGRTSVQYRVTVFQGQTNDSASALVFSTHVTFVNIDEQGKKKSLPK